MDSTNVAWPNGLSGLASDKRYIVGKRHNVARYHA
jgi:hypothetical protein